MYYILFRLELHLIGGFDDDNKTSHNLSREILGMDARIFLGDFFLHQIRVYIQHLKFWQVIQHLWIVRFGVAVAFQKQKEEIHLETCCITGNLVACAHAHVTSIFITLTDRCAVFYRYE